MKLLVIVLCLLSERFLIHSVSYQRFSWFENYYLSIKKILDKNNTTAINSALMLAIIVGPITLLVGLIYGLLHSVLFGFIGLIFNIMIFFYCIGPKNPFYPSAQEATESGNAHVGTYLAQVNNQLFSVIFWYILAGPIAVLIYRLISLSQTINQTAEIAQKITNILEWLPARLTALLYLLVGNFQSGLRPFMSFILAKPEFNNQMLAECGLRAARSNDVEEEVPMPIAESLMEHAIIVLLVSIALFTLVALM